MRLHVGVLGAEKLLCTLDGKSFRLVDINASAVISFARISLGVFVCQVASHCSHNCRRNEIFTGNKLDVASLTVKFLCVNVGYFAVGFSDGFEINH